MQIYEISEVLVYRDGNPVLPPSLFQLRSVSGVRSKGGNFQDVLPVVAQLLGQPASGTLVHKKSHVPETDTAASVSPEITVCAYAMQARMSSGSSTG